MSSNTILFTIIVSNNQFYRVFQVKGFSIGKAFLRQVDRNKSIALFNLFELDTRLSEFCEITCCVKKTLDAFPIRLNEVFLFFYIGVFRVLMLFPFIHHLICFLWILENFFPVKMSFLWKIVIWWFRFSKLRLNKNSVSCSVPREKSWLMHCGHLIKFIFYFYNFTCIWKKS